MLLDTTIAVETPEGVDFTVTPAGVVSRSLAYTTDFFIRVLVIALAMLILAFLGEAGTGIALVIYFLLEWFYPVFFELTKGATPGKKWFKLYVIHDDGSPITFSSSLLRNLLRAADILPMFYLLGLISMVCNGQFKRLGDLAAGTLVVRMTAIKNTPVETTSGVKAPSFALTATEQQAVVQFAQRAQVLSSARRQELANILSPVLNEQNQQAVETIDQMANYLLGRKPSEPNDPSTSRDATESS
ncbi:RDD family protein [Gynuella sunshinyii]|uniref:Putative membrane protein/domain n=1 Tax=Gynuella sunshinyii YC6258 TaxID=1445510 RepID=A0A0C5W360_9GAMM|nr:RDD family protein [Gynuella sunshinyii]AJQ97094.1 putative membrane protein/domain [Gynuella sunshinyii YC6258]